MGLRPPAPKAGASTDSATPATSARIVGTRAGGQRPLRREMADVAQGVPSPERPGLRRELPRIAPLKGKVVAMPAPRNVRPVYTVIHPNCDRPVCKMTKVIVVAILLASVGLMVIITVGGWTELEGLKPVNFIWCLAYVVLAYYAWHWSRGVLPMAAGLAVLLLMIAVVAGAGVTGTSWFDRNHVGFAHAHSIFGGSGLSNDVLGLLTLLLVPVQALLIVVAMIAFAQRWNVELEAPIEQAERRGAPPVVPPAQPSAA